MLEAIAVGGKVLGGVMGMKGANQAANSASRNSDSSRS